MLACFPPLSVASEERLSLDLDIFVLRSIAVVFFAPAICVLVTVCELDTFSKL